MALTVYYSWDNLGRPLTPAWPIREFVGKMKLAFPTAAATNLFGWYADESHYQTNFPEDHTPFSVTGWPEADPPWWVCATDVMHRPDLGVDCGVLVPYWLAEARAERMPWLKYLIWQARLYDVRNGWEPVDTSGHFDHAHLSSRTDHLATSLGGWSVTPEAEGDDDMYLIRQRGSGATYVYNGQYRTYLDSPERLTAHTAALGLALVDVDDVTLYGIEFAPTEYYADRDLVRGLPAQIAAIPGGGSPDTAAIAEAVADELHADPERDGRDR